MNHHNKHKHMLPRMFMLIINDKLINMGNVKGAPKKGEQRFTFTVQSRLFIYSNFGNRHTHNSVSNAVINKSSLRERMRVYS